MISNSDGPSSCRLVEERVMVSAVAYKVCKVSAVTVAIDEYRCKNVSLVEKGVVVPAGTVP